MNTHSWPATLRLAALVSLAAAVVVVWSYNRLSEGVIMAGVILGATAVGWLHAEQVRVPRAAHLLHLRRHPSH
jgi:hypothetical protein